MVRVKDNYWWAEVILDREVSLVVVTVEEDEDGDRVYLPKSDDPLNMNYQREKEMVKLISKVEAP